MNYALLMYCRSGFEPECAAEIDAQLQRLAVVAEPRVPPEGAHVLALVERPEVLETLSERLQLRDLVFARQLILACGPVALSSGDRARPLLEAAAHLADGYGTVYLETADTNAGKSLSGLCKALQVPLRKEAAASGLLRQDSGDWPVLHVFFVSGSEAWVGLSVPGNHAPWPMGVPRLRFPPGAPSRATLKLEEALLTLLEPGERETLLQPGLRAVDLGAAPGGWTWQLVQRHMRVTAVDNGPMDRGLMDSGLVEHLRADAFRYRPPRPVDWMVCDIVDKPARIAALVAEWGTQRWCRACVFNLKLPMKRRYEAVQDCLGHIRGRLEETGVGYSLRVKQLYHDRAEVTGLLLLSAPPARSRHSRPVTGRARK